MNKLFKTLVFVVLCCFQIHSFSYAESEVQTTSAGTKGLYSEEFFDSLKKVLGHDQVSDTIAVDTFIRITPPDIDDLHNVEVNNILRINLNRIIDTFFQSPHSTSLANYLAEHEHLLKYLHYDRKEFKTIIHHNNFESLRKSYYQAMMDELTKHYTSTLGQYEAYGNLSSKEFEYSHGASGSGRVSTRDDLTPYKNPAINHESVHSIDHKFLPNGNENTVINFFEDTFSFARNNGPGGHYHSSISALSEVIFSSYPKYSDAFLDMSYGHFYEDHPGIWQDVVSSLNKFPKNFHYINPLKEALKGEELTLRTSISTAFLRKSFVKNWDNFDIYRKVLNSLKETVKIGQDTDYFKLLQKIKALLYSQLVKAVRYSNNITVHLEEKSYISVIFDLILEVAEQEQSFKNFFAGLILNGHEIIDNRLDVARGTTNRLYNRSNLIEYLFKGETETDRNRILKIISIYGNNSSEVSDVLSSIVEVYYKGERIRNLENSNVLDQLMEVISGKNGEKKLLEKIVDLDGEERGRIAGNKDIGKELNKIRQRISLIPHLAPNRTKDSSCVDIITPSLKE